MTLGPRATQVEYRQRRPSFSVCDMELQAKLLNGGVIENI